VPLTPETAAGRLTTASGQRESATNRLGEHGGMGFGPMWQIMQTFSTSRLIVGGFSVLVPDAVSPKGARIPMSSSSQVVPITLDVLVQNEFTVPKTKNGWNAHVLMD